MTPKAEAQSSRFDLVEVTRGTAPSLGTDLGQSSCQRGLAMVNVTDGTDVDVRFVTFEFFFSHRDRLPSLN